MTSRSDIFARVPQTRALWALGVEELGAIPLDPQMSQSGDRGRPLLIAHPESPQAEEFRAIARRIAAKLGAEGW